jgi:hypothetical protein
MPEHVIFGLIRLRQKLKQMPADERIDEVLCQLNVIMQMLLKQEVCIDFLTVAHPGSTVMPKLVQLLKTSEPLGADIHADLQYILSACVSSTVLGSSETRLPCSGMSTSEKMQHMRSSLTLML